MTVFKDFVRYMDTTYPRNVDRVKYTDLKYMVREESNRFVGNYDNISFQLLEKVALYQFLMKTDEEKLAILEEYLDETIKKSP